jgi:polyhydroxyalkanoate synthase subunit PhaE
MATTSNDFAAIARQYWDMWGNALRDAAPATGFDTGMPNMSGMRDMLDTWTKQVGGASPFGNILNHFNHQNSDWYTQMQQVAAQFIGRDHRASDVVNAWKNAFGNSHPFESLLESMRGPGLESIMQWSESAAPWMNSKRNDLIAALDMPAFGMNREHQERMQALAKAQLQMQAAFDAFNGLLSKISQDSFHRFELMLAEREEPGRQLTTVRALFDLWVDAAEDAWAEAALSQEYRSIFGELANAQMRVRSALKAINEHTANMLGLPGRTELDSAHRKIAELERHVRRMQREAAAKPVASKPAAAPQAQAPAVKETAKPAISTIVESKPAAPAASRPVVQADLIPALKTPVKPAAKPVAKPAAKPAVKAASKAAAPVKAATAKPAAPKAAPAKAGKAVKSAKPTTTSARKR